MNILNVLTFIDSDSKRSHKVAVLEQHKDNAEFMRVVKLALDPYINFHIRKIPDYKTKLNENQAHKTLSWAMDELEKLSKRQLTGNAGIEHLRSVLGSLSADDAVVIERIIGKDLRCGMADGIVNAVVDKFIPSYPCLLARPYDAKNIKNIVYPAYSQLKADGLRVNIHTKDTIEICGRSGRDIDLLGAMDEAFFELAKLYPEPMVFDGELVVLDDSGKILSRKVGNGIINKAIKGTISAEEAKRVRAQLWDAIPLKEFKNGISTQTYKERFDTLKAKIDSLQPKGEDATAAVLSGNTVKYWTIPCKEVNSLEEATEHFNEMLAAGQEGTILKNWEAFWEDTRSKHLVKFKAEQECDLEIIGFTPGTGKFTGMVGSLQCASRDRLVEVNISGFTDDERLELTQTITQKMGSVISVMYNERIKSKSRTGVDSLFLPRCAEFRFDKTVADESKDIK